MREFSIDYTRLPIMFRLGSSVFWEQEKKTLKNIASFRKAHVEKPQKRVVVEHSDIISQSFWKAHPSILNEKHRCCENCIHNFLSDTVLLRVVVLVFFLFFLNAMVR